MELTEDRFFATLKKLEATTDEKIRSIYQGIPIGVIILETGAEIKDARSLILNLWRDRKITLSSLLWEKQIEQKLLNQINDDVWLVHLCVGSPRPLNLDFI